MGPSFVQSINGKPMQFHRMGGRRLNPDSLEPLVPYMVATTYAFLCLLLLQLGRKPRPYYAVDLATSLACVTLQHFKQPLLSFHLAIGYTVWNLAPGSLGTIELPTHKDFLRNLKIKEPADPPTECVICWDDDQTIAELPCGHQFCLPCIKLMPESENFQTTCPTCRKPLFNIAERFQTIGRKGNYTCFVLNFARAVFQFAHEMMRPRYDMAALAFAQICFLLAFPAYLIYKVWAAGALDGWWTDKPTAKSWNDLRTSATVVIASVILICTNFWSDYSRFG